MTPNKPSEDLSDRSITGGEPVQSHTSGVEFAVPIESTVMTYSDGIRPGSRVTITFDLWSADDMKAVRALVDQAAEDAIAAVRRKVGIVQGAEDIPDPWVRMIARSGARLTLGCDRNPDRDADAA